MVVGKPVRFRKDVRCQIRTTRGLAIRRLTRAALPAIESSRGLWPGTIGVHFSGTVPVQIGLASGRTDDPKESAIRDFLRAA